MALTTIFTSQCGEFNQNVPMNLAGVVIQATRRFEGGHYATRLPGPCRNSPRASSSTPINQYGRYIPSPAYIVLRESAMLPGGSRRQN